MTMNKIGSAALFGFLLLTYSCSSDQPSNTDRNEDPANTASAIQTAEVEYDTIVSFDPETFQETVTIVERGKTKDEAKEVITTAPEATLNYVSIRRGTEKDTLIVFNPSTYEELVSIHESGTDMLELLKGIEGDAFHDFIINKGTQFDTIVSLDKARFQLNRYLIEKNQ